MKVYEKRVSLKKLDSTLDLAQELDGVVDVSFVDRVESTPKCTGSPTKMALIYITMIPESDPPAGWTEVTGKAIDW